jgi:hypothetical protein
VNSGHIQPQYLNFAGFYATIAPRRRGRTPAVMQIAGDAPLLKTGLCRLLEGFLSFGCKKLGELLLPQLCRKVHESSVSAPTSLRMPKCPGRKLLEV